MGHVQVLIFKPLRHTRRPSDSSSTPFDFNLFIFYAFRFHDLPLNGTVCSAPPTKYFQVQCGVSYGVTTLSEWPKHGIAERI